MEKVAIKIPLEYGTRKVSAGFYFHSLVFKTRIFSRPVPKIIKVCFESPELIKQEWKAIQGIYPRMSWWESLSPTILLVNSLTSSLHCV